MSDKKPSKYATKNKWLYSTTYQLWKEAALKEGASSQKAIALSCQHAKAWGYKNAACV